MVNQMYPNVVPYNPLCGRCGMHCQYCSTNSLRKRYEACAKKYSGEYRIDEKVLNKNLGSGKTVFVVAQNDLFEADVPDEMIIKILNRMLMYPNNTYMIQTKNPARYSDMINYGWGNYGCSWTYSKILNKVWLGTTIETNRNEIILSQAPSVLERATAMCNLPNEFKKYITIEPIVDFDVNLFVDMLAMIKPDKIYIGADSKHNNLPEPSAKKTADFVSRLIIDEHFNVELKSNLPRVMGEADFHDAIKYQIENDLIR